MTYVTQKQVLRSEKKRRLGRQKSSQGFFWYDTNYKTLSRPTLSNDSLCIILSRAREAGSPVKTHVLVFSYMFRALSLLVCLVVSGLAGDPTSLACDNIYNNDKDPKTYFSVTWLIEAGLS